MAPIPRPYLNLIMSSLCTLILLFIITSCSKKGEKESETFSYANNTSEYSTSIIDNITEYSTIPSDADQIAELEALYANTSEESFEDRFESSSPWHKEYFKNEWGEDMISRPFLYTTLMGSSWDIHLDYVPFISEGVNGVFRMFIMNDEGGFENLYAPVNILVRGSDGETKSVEVTSINDGIIYIQDPATVDGLKYYLNNEQFDILIEFDKWNERHRTQAHWWSEPGFFQRAIDTML